MLRSDKMSEYNIRVAVESDAEELQKLMYESFTPLRELGIDWPSVNADVELVKKNIKTSTMFVLENDHEIISTLTVRYPWEGKRRVSIYPFVWWFATKPSYDGKGIGKIRKSTRLNSSHVSIS